MTNNLTSAPESAPRRWRLVLTHIVIAAAVMATTAVVFRELFVPHTITDVSAPQVLTHLIGWQVLCFSAFTFLRLTSTRRPPVGAAIEMTVLAVMGAILPAVAVLLLAPWAWVVLAGVTVVTAATAVRHIIDWRRNSRD